MGHLSIHKTNAQMFIISTQSAVMNTTQKHENFTLPIARFVQCSSKYMASCIELVTNIRSASVSSPCHNEQL